MRDLKLIIGNKNYSSWSLRPWIALKVSGIAFAEEVVPLDLPDTKGKLAGLSPSGLVPILRHAGGTVWDSLAICETVAERFPAAALWPSDPDARALARSVAAEMHGGFGDLRAAMPMNIRREGKPVLLGDAAKAQVARVQAIWRDCRGRAWAKDGPFLFGRFSVADAMYAPVATRFRSYAVALDPSSADYVRAVHDLPAMRSWREAAAAEPWAMPKYDAL